MSNLSVIISIGLTVSCWLIIKCSSFCEGITLLSTPVGGEDNPQAHKNITRLKYSERGAGQDCVDPETLTPDVGDSGYIDIKTPDRPGREESCYVVL